MTTFYIIENNLSKHMQRMTEDRLKKKAVLNTGEAEIWKWGIQK